MLEKLGVKSRWDIVPAVLSVLLYLNFIVFDIAFCRHRRAASICRAVTADGGAAYRGNHYPSYYQEEVVKALAQAAAGRDSG